MHLNFDTKENRVDWEFAFYNEHLAQYFEVIHHLLYHLQDHINSNLIE